MRSFVIFCLIGCFSVVAAVPSQSGVAEDEGQPAPQTKANVAPPAIDGVDWVTVPYEKAENQVLALLHADLSKIGKLANSTAIYQIKVSGHLPQSYAQRFRTKLEQLIVRSGEVSLKQCTSCDQSRLVHEENGKIRYEAVNQDPHRASKIAKELGVPTLLYTELYYSPGDLRLGVRLVDPFTSDVLWVNDYSTADVTKTRQNLYSDNKYYVGEGNSLARVLIGEIAFTTVFSFGSMWAPTIKSDSYDGGNTFYPSVDLFIGEKYDSGHKRFGFNLGAMLNVSEPSTFTKPIDFALRVGTNFRYTFNPYSVDNAQWSMMGEFGGMVGAGLITGYLGLGVEVMMMKRFSVSFMPMGILPTEVAGETIMVEGDQGFSEQEGASRGEFGGIGAIVKLNINW